jgi:hypothetical protein
MVIELGKVILVTNCNTVTVAGLETRLEPSVVAAVT